MSRRRRRYRWATAFPLVLMSRELDSVRTGMAFVMIVLVNEDRTMSESPNEPGVLVNLPAALHYLIEPALRLGLATEPDIFQYLDEVSPQQNDELRRIAERVLANDHYPMVNKFLDAYPITDHDESAKLYFLFGALDYSGLQFDRVPEG
jgi:hypothetical protein